MATTEHRERERGSGRPRITPVARAGVAVALSALTVVWMFGPRGLLAASLAVAVGLGTAWALGMSVPLSALRGDPSSGRGLFVGSWPLDPGGSGLAEALEQVPRWLLVAVAAVPVAGLVGWLLGPFTVVALVVAAGLGLTGYRLVRNLAVPVEGDQDRPATSRPSPRFPGELPWRRHRPEGKHVGARGPSWWVPVPSQAGSSGPDGATATQQRDDRTEAAEHPGQRRWDGQRSARTEPLLHQRFHRPAPPSASGSSHPEHDPAAPAWMSRASTQPVEPDLGDPASVPTTEVGAGGHLTGGPGSTVADPAPSEGDHAEATDHQPSTKPALAVADRAGVRRDADRRSAPGGWSRPSPTQWQWDGRPQGADHRRRTLVERLEAGKRGLLDRVGEPGEVPGWLMAAVPAVLLAGLMALLLGPLALLVVALLGGLGFGGYRLAQGLAVPDQRDLSDLRRLGQARQHLRRSAPERPSLPELLRLGDARERLLGSGGVLPDVPGWVPAAVAAVLVTALVAWLLGPLALLVVAVLAGLGFAGHRLVRILTVPVEGDDRPAAGPGPRLGRDLPWRRDRPEADALIRRLTWRRDRPEGSQPVRRQPSWSPSVLFRSLATGPGPAGASAPERDHWVETSELPEERKWAEQWSRLTEQQHARTAPAPPAPTGGRPGLATVPAQAWTPRAHTRPIHHQTDPAPIPAAGDGNHPEATGRQCGHPAPAPAVDDRREGTNGQTDTVPIPRARPGDGAQATKGHQDEPAPAPVPGKGAGSVSANGQAGTARVPAWTPRAHTQPIQAHRPDPAPGPSVVDGAGTRPDRDQGPRTSVAAPPRPEPWQWDGRPQGADHRRRTLVERLEAGKRGLLDRVGEPGEVPGWLMAAVPAVLLAGLMALLLGPLALLVVALLGGLGFGGYRLAQGLAVPDQRDLSDLRRLGQARQHLRRSAPERPSLPELLRLGDARERLLGSGGVLPDVPGWVPAAVAAVLVTALVAWLLGPLALLVVAVLAGLGFAGHRLVRILTVPVEGDDRPAAGPGPRLGRDLPWRRDRPEADALIRRLTWRRDRPEGSQPVRRQPSWSPSVLFRSLATGPGPAGASAPERDHWVETSELPEERKWAEQWSRLTEQQHARTAPAPPAPTGGRPGLATVPAQAWTPRAHTRPIHHQTDPAPAPAARADGGAQATSDQRSHTAPAPSWNPPAHPQPTGDRRPHPSPAPAVGAGAATRPLHHQQVPSAGPPPPEPWQWQGRPQPAPQPARPPGRRSEAQHEGLFVLPGPLAEVPGWLVVAVPALLIAGLLGWLVGPAAMVAVVVLAGLGLAGDRLVRILGAPGDPGSQDGDAVTAPRRPVAGILPWERAQAHSDHGRRQGVATAATGRMPSTRPGHEGRQPAPAEWGRTTWAFPHAAGQPATWRPAPGARPQRDQGGSSVWSERLEKLPQGCLVSALVATGLWFAFWAVVLVFALYVLVGGTFP